jgi:DNA-binding NarL/FixJ family response regulator
MTSENTKQTVLEIDGLTGQAIEREATESELAQIKERLKDQADQDAKLVARVAARQSALAKLAALGLTESEIAAL